MKNEEAGALVALAAANFPHIQEKDLGPTVALWREMLSDLPFDLAKAALIKVLVTAKFWPTVAEIREAAAELSRPAALTPAEAWAQVITAIRKDWKPDQLHPTVREALVGFGGLDRVGMSENIDVIRGQFLKVYEQYAYREKEHVLLPPSVRQLVERAAKALPATPN